MRFRAGDLVEVKSAEEILATLDERGIMDGLPFMPEMLRYCGRQFRVDKVAHKTCDTIHYSGNRRMTNAVHLEGIRCDGSEHGGCQAACLTFWKEDWLKKPGQRELTHSAQPKCTVQGLRQATQRVGDSPEDIRYVCQITQLPTATSRWAWWNPTQYVADVSSGNHTARHVFRTLVRAALRGLIVRFPNHAVFRTTYNSLAKRWSLPLYFCREDLAGPVARTAQAADASEALKAGDWVKVRPRSEIVATLNSRGKNRGLHFDVEMVRYCGKRHKVREVVTQIIDEGTGRMLQMKNPCIMLEGVICMGDYSEQRLLCPRSIAQYWRPAWLEKLPDGDG